MSFRILVMAKAPIPGTVKTRLRLPPEDAATLQAALIADAASKARGLAPTTVAGAPRDRLGRIRPLLPEDVPLIPQQGADLGERMLAAARALFEDAPDPVVILGTDAPTLPPEAISQAAGSLEAHDLSMIPSVDGGYVLLGLRGLHESIFSGIEWSTPKVHGQTLLRAEDAGLSVHGGATGHDLDEPADLVRVREELRARPWLASRTAGVLRLL